MATEVVETIGSGGDFADISAWVAALPSDLTAEDEVRIGRLIEAKDYSESSTISISSITTDATRYVQLEAASGVRHNGSGDESGARYIYTGGGHAFQVDIDHFRVRWIDFSYPSGGSASDEIFRWNGEGEFWCEFCLGHDIPHKYGDFFYIGTGTTATKTLYFQNCMFWNLGRSACHNQSEENATWYIYNCTAWETDLDSAPDGSNGDPYGAYGFSGSPNSGSVMVCKNCYGDTGTNEHAITDGLGFYDKDNNGDFTGSDFNISSDGSAPGSNSQTNVSPTGEFLSLSGTIDLHIVSGGTLEHAGTDLSADSDFAITDDIDGQTRSGTWDVGADQTVSTEATYSTNFGDYTTGQQPSDWTARLGTPADMFSVEEVSGVLGGKVLRAETSTTFTAPAYLTWDEIDSDAERQDAEILAKVRFLTNEDGLHLVVRGGDGADGYLLFVNPVSDDIRIEKFVGGSFTSDLASTAKTIDTNTWYWLRFRVNGSDLMARVWEDGTSEPGSWDVTTTDSDITSDGWVGINYFDEDELAEIEFDAFGVGTGGATAPEPVTDITLDAEAGVVEVIGQNADLLRSLVLDSESGVIETVGQDADLLRSLRLGAEAGVIEVVGQDADFLKALILSAEAGVVEVVGQDADLLLSLRLEAESGVIEVVGQDAGLGRQITLSAESGVIETVGQDADLIKALKLLAESGSVEVVGQDAGLLLSLRLDAEAGTIEVVGQDAELLKALRLSAESGVIEVVGQDAELTKALKLAAEAGVIEVVGQDADLLKDFLLAAESGSIEVVGQDVEFLVTLRLSAEAGVIDVVGQDAELTVSFRLAAESGSIEVVGQDADLLRDLILSAEAGEIEVVGQDAALFRILTLAAEAGVIEVVGQDAGLTRDLILQAEAGVIIVAGHDASFSTTIWTDCRDVDASEWSGCLVPGDADFGDSVTYLFMYADVGEESDPSEFRVYDVSDRSSPELVGTLEYPFISENNVPMRVHPDGDYVYLPDTGDEGVLAVINVEDKENPTLETTVGLTAEFFFPAASYSDLMTPDGNWLFIPMTQGQIDVLDLSDPAAPTLAATFDGTGITVDSFEFFIDWVPGRDMIAYVSKHIDTDEDIYIGLLDASDPENLSHISEISVTNEEDGGESLYGVAVHPDGEYLYVFGNDFVRDETGDPIDTNSFVMFTYDIRDENNITLVGSTVVFDTVDYVTDTNLVPNTAHWRAPIHLDAEVVYKYTLADVTEFDHHNIFVAMDVSDAANPVRDVYFKGTDIIAGFEAVAVMNGDEYIYSGDSRSAEELFAYISKVLSGTSPQTPDQVAKFTDPLESASNNVAVFGTGDGDGGDSACAEPGPAEYSKC